MASKFHQAIEEIARAAGAEAVAVSLHDYLTGTSQSYEGARWFHAASTIKVGVLLSLFMAVEAGRFSLRDTLHVRNRFISVESRRAFSVEPESDANGEVHAAVGKLMQIGVLAEHMIATSSNLATNLLLDLVGLEAAQAFLEELDVRGIDLRRGVEDEDAFNAGINNRVTADGLIGLFRRLEDGNGFPGAVAEAMLQILHMQQVRSGIPAGIPEAVRTHAQFAHKPGEISTVTHDAGIVYLPERPPYVVAILTEWPPHASERRETVASLSRVVYDHLTTKGSTMT